MKKHLLSLIAALLLCMLLPAACAMAAEAEWRTGFDGATLGSGTLNEALAAAKANDAIKSIHLLEDVDNVAVSISDISDRELQLLFGECNVTAAEDSPAFTIGSNLSDTILNFYSLNLTSAPNGNRELIRINGTDTTLWLDDKCTLYAADGQPAVVLEEGNLQCASAFFPNPNASCDIEYKGGFLDLAKGHDPHGMVIKNATASNVTINSPDFANMIKLPEGFYLLDGSAQATSFEAGKTYTVEGPATISLYFDLLGTPETKVTKVDPGNSYTVPQCPSEWVHPETANGWTFTGWYYYDKTGERQSVLPGDVITPSYSLMLYCQWEDLTPNAVFMSTSGSGESFTMIIVNGSITLPQKPANFTHSNPAMQFKGWEYYDEGANRSITCLPGETVTGLTEETYFYAVWDDDMYTAQFHSENSTGLIFYVSQPDPLLVLPECPFTPDDPSDHFAGWRYWDEVKDASVLLQPGDTVTLPYDDLSIYAWWDDGVHTLTIVDAEGNETEYTTTASTYTVPKAIMDYPDQEFLGWKYDDPFQLNYYLLQPGDVITLMGDPFLYEQWVWPSLTLNHQMLQDGDYMDNDGNILSARPSGGYAHYQNGVLTLHDFAGNQLDTSGIDLTIVLEGENSLVGEYDAICSLDGHLTIKGSGSLKLHTSYEDIYSAMYLENSSLFIEGGNLMLSSREEAIVSKSMYSNILHDVVISGGTLKLTSTSSDGIYCDDDILVSGGTLNITAGSDGIDSEANLTITGGSITINANDNGLETYMQTLITGGALNITANTDGIDGEESITITGGDVSIRAKDSGMDSDESSITINGGSVQISAEHYNGLEADEGSITISGGKVGVTARQKGLYAKNIHIAGGDVSVSAIGSGGLAFAATRSLRVDNDLMGMTIGQVTLDDGKVYYTLLRSGAPVSACQLLPKTASLPQTGDSTPVALLALLMLTSAFGCLVLRRRSA